jgi:NADPH:quinone reductase-like Zn-dependent oxidoreductase
MKAAVYEKYGVLEIRDIDPPVVPDDGVLVRVRAAALNALDWYFFSGSYYLTRLFIGLARPKRSITGVDYAGVVESVGSKVTRFKPGDEVFGGVRGSFAELVCVPEDRPARKPPGVTFEQAASLPVAGLTALQGLRDIAKVQAGESVLINGASGGVGSFAIQIAKVLGARVTAVCSTRNVDQARMSGADRVIDYTKEDFTRCGQLHDLIYDVAGSRSWGEYRRVLEPKGRFVLAGGVRTNRWIGPVSPVIKLRMASLFGGPKFSLSMARRSRQDLETLADLVATGRLKPVIERYDFDAAPAALRYLGEGHPRGKIVVSM